MPKYRHRGARALVLLHERHMQEFLETWQRFRRSGTALPESDDRWYASPQALLTHVLACAGGYLVWMCRQLDLPDPGIDPLPDMDAVEAEAERYLEHVLERWKAPLAELPEEAFYRPSFTSRWDAEYCIDAMLEHAVMHPIRHTFQLRELMDGPASHGRI